jgi:small-conductance mechanosensitive channel
VHLSTRRSTIKRILKQGLWISVTHPLISVAFFSDNVFRIEKVKSEIRKIINRKFIENGITIPFPQVDLHLKDESGRNR